MRVLLFVLILVSAGCSAAGSQTLIPPGYDVYSFTFVRGTATNFVGTDAADPTLLELGRILSDSGSLYLGLGTDAATHFEVLKLQDGPAYGSSIPWKLWDFMDTHSVSQGYIPPPWQGTVTVDGDVAAVTLAARHFSVPANHEGRLGKLELIGTFSKPEVDEAVASVADVRYGEQLISGEIASHWTVRGTLDGVDFELEFDQPLTCWSSHGNSNDPRAASP